MLPELAKWLTAVISCHLLHWSITEAEAAHTLLEGVAVCPKWENPGLCAPRTLGLHPRPLVLFLPCSAPSVLSHLLLWALSAFLPCFHILGLSSCSHLWTHFICLMLPVIISPSELLPTSCFHLSSSRCYVSVLFFLSLTPFPVLPFSSPPSSLVRFYFDDPRPTIKLYSQSSCLTGCLFLSVDLRPKPPTPQVQTPRL